MDILTFIAVASLMAGGVSCIAIAVDLRTHPQPMRIMNVVWPVTGLYSGPLGLWAYYRIGRRGGHMRQGGGMENGGEMKAGAEIRGGGETIRWQQVVTGTLHCGAGCTLGDLLAEGVLSLAPVSIAGSRLAGSWTVEYVFAFLIGILFQYYAIRPMKRLSRRQTLLAALKADSLSLTCWQVGMYGWMAVAGFVLLHRTFAATDPRFWWLMQIGMLAGFLTAYPVNRWLLKRGIKETM